MYGTMSSKSGFGVPNWELEYYLWKPEFPNADTDLQISGFECQNLSTTSSFYLNVKVMKIRNIFGYYRTHITVHQFQTQFNN